MKTKSFGRVKYIIFVVFCCLLAVATAFPQTGAGRKPSLAVIEFAVRPKISREAGRELSDMLVNALLESQRFTVVDRSKTNEILKEQREVLIGSIDPTTGAEVGKRLGAQFLIIGSVTEFEEKKASGLGMLSSVVKIPGANKVAVYRATVKFNLQVINSTTGEIAFSKSFEKEVENAGLSGDGAIFDIPNFKSKAMQDAVGQAMQDAVATLIERLGASAPPNSVAEVPVNSVINCSRVTGAKAPRVMVVIPEIHITRKIPDPAGETEIIKKLVAHGFNVVDQKQVAAIRDREKVLTALKNPQAAAALGVEFGADIIIIGEAFSELASRDRNFISTRARVEARAIQTSTARILAADGKFGSGLDIAEFVSAKTALRNAGTQWADYFIAQICQAPLTNGGGSSTTEAVSSSVEVLVSNVSFAQLKQFSDRLEKISGVKSVEKKLTGNVARVDVQYDGSAEKLADAISETKFGLLKVNIVGLSGNKIEISIGK